LIAEKIGSQLRGGEIIDLKSDIGGGKTSFVRGLVRGAKSTDHVSSPTFTISQQYQANDRTIYHYDFYRLPDAGIMRHEIAELFHQPNTIIVVEWSDIIDDILPVDRVTITFVTTGENDRLLEVTYPKKLEYLFFK